MAYLGLYSFSLKVVTSTSITYGQIATIPTAGTYLYRIDGGLQPGEVRSPRFIETLFRILHSHWPR